MVALGREGFLAIAPPFTGDILWEHLEILQKGLLYTIQSSFFSCSTFQWDIYFAYNLPNLTNSLLEKSLFFVFGIRSHGHCLVYTNILYSEHICCCCSCC